MTSGDHMSQVTIIWAMIASACLTLAAMHVLVWIKDRLSWANLMFSILAVSVAGIAAFELAMMRAQTPEQFGTLLRWLLVPVFVGFLAILGFVRFYFRVGRLWLAHVTWSARLAGLIVNFTTDPNLIYREITGLRHSAFLGDTVTVAEAIPSRWLWLDELSVLLLLAFVADATLTLWRRGDAAGRRRAVVVGGSLTTFILVAGSLVALVHQQLIVVPYLVSLPFSIMLGAMGYELSHDVLRAAQLARELRESERRMEMATSAANLGVWTWDIIRDEIWATSSARALLGFAESERLNLNRFMTALHPGDREAVRCAIEKSLAGGGEYEAEYRVLLPGDQIRWVAARGRVEIGAGGKPVLMRGVALDITARRRSEIETQELRQGLAHAGRITMMGQLASALAHELNQPLGAILRNAEAADLLLQSASPDLDELRAIVSDIHKDDRRAGDVIDRLRTLLKRRSHQAQALVVGKLVDEVISILRSDAAARHVKLEMDVPAGLPPVHGDRVHLQQVLLNLIINAMDAINSTSEGDDKRRVTVRARIDEARMIEVAVSDPGHGISPEKIAQIFDPFFTTKANGMGMGLAISRTIIGAHGGRIWAENNAECGATFRFALPVAKEGDAS